VPPTLDYYLTLAGEFWQEKEKIVQKIADKSLQRNIEIIDRYLSEKEAAELFHRADLVVLPYRSATGSGVISLAYHYNKPVLITRVGGLPDMVIDGETGLIVSPGSPAAMAAALSAISRQSLAAMAASIAEHKRQFSWDGLVQTILRASSANFVN
jgi:glycosyltransferase involved in cell wall biosynthesis